MGKNNNKESTVRVDISKTIKDCINSNMLSSAMSSGQNVKFDAICHVIMRAVDNANLLTLSGIPHVYSGSSGIYIPFDYHEFRSALNDVLFDIQIPYGLFSRTSKLVSECWSEVMCHKKCVDKSVVVMGNGVYDTIDGCLHKFSPNYITNMKVDYEYNADEYPSRWLSFLDEVLPDKQMQMTLQEFVAAAFIDRSKIKFEHMLILLGGGSNGKSVVYEVISGLLGDDNVSNFSVKDLITAGKSEMNIASCNGMRLNYCSEIKTTDINERCADSFKSVVSGEAMMARSLYQEPFKATEIPIIMVNANKLPRIQDPSYSLQRRIIIIPFDVRIPEDMQDRELGSSLRGELTGVFNWVMEGYRRLSSNEFRITISSTVKALVEKYIMSNNPVLRWLSDNGYGPAWAEGTDCIPEFILVGDLYDSYQLWCNGHDEQPLTKMTFSKELDSRGYSRRRRTAGTGFLIFRKPKAEDIASVRMELDAAKNRQEYISILRAEAEKKKIPSIVGFDATEIYLGLERNSLSTYLMAGHLSGTYITRPDGQIEFDIQKLQAALAMAGYYQAKMNGKSVFRNATSHLRGMRRTFNCHMRSLGLPFRKYDSRLSTIPAEDINCIIVPDDWEYSKRAAEIVLSRRENLCKTNKNNGNGTKEG